MSMVDKQSPNLTFQFKTLNLFQFQFQHTTCLHGAVHGVLTSTRHLCSCVCRGLLHVQSGGCRQPRLTLPCLACLFSQPVGLKWGAIQYLNKEMDP